MAESTPTPQNAAADLPRCLLGHWIRSHEEDKAGVRAYRPASYKFPPSRGRDGFEFRARGELVYFGIARGDGSESLPGTWILEGSDRLRISVKTTRFQPFVLQVVSCDGDLLKVRPVDQG
jgi:hypothetical protein